MSYSESGIDLLFFSADRDALLTLSSEFRDKIEKKGGEYTGPMKPEQVNSRVLQAFLLHISDPESKETISRSDFPSWLFEALDSEEHLELMISASQDNDCLFARRYQIMGDRVISAVLSFDITDEVMTVATSVKKNHQKGSSSPYTWDPNVDHIPSHPDGPW